MRSESYGVGNDDLMRENSVKSVDRDVKTGVFSRLDEMQ